MEEPPLVRRIMKEPLIRQKKPKAKILRRGEKSDLWEISFNCSDLKIFFRDFPNYQEIRELQKKYQNIFDFWAELNSDLYCEKIALIVLVKKAAKPLFFLKLEFL